MEENIKKEVIKERTAEMLEIVGLTEFKDYYPSQLSVFITHNVEEAVSLGERIMVLTNKPTKVKEILPCDLPRPRDVTDEKFVEVRNKVTDLIRWR